jgi:hypothetical protein
VLAFYLFVFSYFYAEISYIAAVNIAEKSNLIIGRSYPDIGYLVKIAVKNAFENSYLFPASNRSNPASPALKPVKSRFLLQKLTE